MGAVIRITETRDSKVRDEDGWIDVLHLAAHSQGALDTSLSNGLLDANKIDITPAGAGRNVRGYVLFAASGGQYYRWFPPASSNVDT